MELLYKDSIKDQIVISSYKSETLKRNSRVGHRGFDGQVIEPMQ